MNKVVNIIGAGLAGSEAAYQLAKRNIKVNLYESKNVKANDVQKLSSFAELVCSNSLRSDDMSNAVGTLKEEMRMLDSLIIKAAQYAKVPAGGSLAVDRDMFSKYITDTLKSNSLISIYEEEKTDIDPNEINLIATGPLTTESFQTYLSKLLGQDDFYFFDAVAPIIEKDSINFDIAFRKNRYEKGETQDYINCPMTKEQYNVFYNELIKGDIAISHLEEEKSLKYFEACMPVEAIAKRGENTLLFGPMKPQGLTAPNGVKPYAVVQLRQDNASDTLYNLVGFQTNLKWLEQERIFSLIPGLENIKIVRHGVMHKNNYLNSPKLLNNFLQLKTNPNIFFAGQITGVEGYVESTVTGLITAINIANFINEKEMTVPTSATVTGALLRYINVISVDFQPMKANWGIVKSLDLANPRITKTDKKKLYSTRAIKEMKEYIISNNIGDAND